MERSDRIVSVLVRIGKFFTRLDQFNFDASQLSRKGGLNSSMNGNEVSIRTTPNSYPESATPQEIAIECCNLGRLGYKSRPDRDFPLGSTGVAATFGVAE